MSWKDHSSYDYILTHTVKDWGWEFIRRDKRYRDEWKKEFEQFKKTKGKQVLMPLLVASDALIFSDLKISRPTKEPLNLTKPDDMDSFMILSEDANKWGLQGYQNPDCKKLNKDILLPVKKLFVDALDKRVLVEDGDEGPIQIVDDEVTISLKDHTLIIVLDLKKPLAPQIDEISRRARERQDNLRKANPELVTFRAEEIGVNDRSTWIIYLRCLDARAAGEKRIVAARTIFPNNTNSSPRSEKKWDEALRQVKNLGGNHFIQFMT